jgi:hypothetical protein
MKTNQVIAVIRTNKKSKQKVVTIPKELKDFQAGDRVLIQKIKQVVIE